MTALPRALCTAGLVLMAQAMPLPALAGPIGEACLRSDSPARNRPLCACIDGIAGMHLSGSDQRRAARFFRDPELAERTQLSDTPRDDAFWERWVAYGDAAAAACGPQDAAPEE
jgi:hypothetical protein